MLLRTAHDNVCQAVRNVMANAWRSFVRDRIVRWFRAI